MLKNTLKEETKLKQNKMNVNTVIISKDEYDKLIKFKEALEREIGIIIKYDYTVKYFYPDKELESASKILKEKDKQIERLVNPKDYLMQLKLKKGDKVYTSSFLGLRKWKVVKNIKKTKQLIVRRYFKKEILYYSKVIDKV